MPLSDEDEDDDYAHFTTETESQAKGHSRHSSNEDGHLYAGHHSVAGGYTYPRHLLLFQIRNKTACAPLAGLHLLIKCNNIIKTSPNEHFPLLLDQVLSYPT